MEPDRFWSSEEYDDHAHTLYTEGDFDGALETLKEGLALYPNAVDLYVGLGYARLAREEFAWARQAFERSLALDPDHEDALVGLGKVLLRVGVLDEGLRCFRRVEQMGFDDDIELMMTMGRAVLLEGLYPRALDIFSKLAVHRPDCAEALACIGFAVHQMGDEVDAARHLRRALRIEPDLFEARVYLGHLLYERGDSAGALREFEQVPPAENWDLLSLYRYLELRGEEADGIDHWRQRLDELRSFEEDPVERLLSEVEAAFEAGERLRDQNQLELFSPEVRRIEVRVPGRREFRGSWQEVVRAIRDDLGFEHDRIHDFMRRMAERWHEQLGVTVPATDPEAFLRGAERAGVLHLKVLD